MFNGVSSPSYGCPNDIASNDESIKVYDEKQNNNQLALKLQMRNYNKEKKSNHITVALNAMSYWEKRNGIEKSTSK